ncbi:MAG TPA: 4Fe-4S ferredoxin, partial [Methanocorpusculum sp.]|nr:4Fe-4S ferredoxin [Methanocorpusculum sp.]
FVPDIGILASRDPVALDKACYDLVNAAEGVQGSLLPDHHEAGEEKFTRIWPGTSPELQLEAAEEMNVGRREYRLVEV